VKKYKLQSIKMACLLMLAAFYFIPAFAQTNFNPDDLLKPRTGKQTLVNVVKGGADYEQTTLQKIAEARAKANSINAAGITAENYQQQSAAQDELAAAANRLLITVEKYPELKGTKAFAGLQTQLERTELRIKIARKDFNGAVATYNSSVKSFPTKVVAALLGFPPKEGFQSDAGADKSVEIKF
jgi:LemA protein